MSHALSDTPKTFFLCVEVHIWTSSPCDNDTTVNVLKFLTLHFLFSNKILVVRTRIHEMLVSIANREDPDQTASEEAVWSESALFV